METSEINDWYKKLDYFFYHALIYRSYVSFYFDLSSLTSTYSARASLIGEAVVHDVEAMLSNVIDAGIQLNYQVWQRFEE